MVTLNAKLNGVEDDKLISRVVEIWGFFWDQVLTYLEGVSPFPFLILPNLTQVPGSATAANGSTAAISVSDTEKAIISHSSGNIKDVNIINPVK